MMVARATPGKEPDMIEPKKVALFGHLLKQSFPGTVLDGWLPWAPAATSGIGSRVSREFL